MNTRNYVVLIEHGRKKTKRRHELRNLTKRQRAAKRLSQEVLDFREEVPAK